MDIISQILVLLITLCCCGKILTVDYEVVGDHDRFMDSCSKEDDKGNMQLSDFIDVSSLKRVYSDDLDFVYLNGNIVVKHTLPLGYPIKVATEILYWSGNQWMNTMFSIRRNDLCKDLFDPSEFWYEFMSQLPKEQRECPPKKGTLFTLESVPARIPISLPSLNIPSQLKIVSHISVANSTICVTVYAHIYKM